MIDTHRIITETDRAFCTICWAVGFILALAPCALYIGGGLLIVYLDKNFTWGMNPETLLFVFNGMIPPVIIGFYIIVKFLRLPELFPDY